MSSGHTPGPWYVTGSSPEGCVYSSEHELIVPWSPLQSDRKMANARLIAAAPEMADCLRNLVASLNAGTLVIYVQDSHPRLDPKAIMWQPGNLDRVSALLAKMDGSE